MTSIMLNFLPQGGINISLLHLVFACKNVTFEMGTRANCMVVHGRKKLSCR